MNVDEELTARLESREAPASRDWLDAQRAEVAQYSAEMKELSHMPVDEGMDWISSISARVHELILLTVSFDGRLATKWRIEGLLPTRDELRFQFELKSRRLTLMKIEAEQLRGVYT